jgi:hypothetical protein
MSSPLGNPFAEVQDGENNPIEFDIAYPLRGGVVAAVDELRRRHGEAVFLLPLSGQSCGGGIFQTRRKPPGTVVGLRFDPPAEAAVRLDQQTDLSGLGPQEIVIDTTRQLVHAGAAVTLEQLNQALGRELGSACRVAGADLTSYQYAAVGATFMTGGMGPQRRYFSDSVVAAAIFDGERSVEIDGGALEGYAGTYGWSGLVTAVSCRYQRFPSNEIAFALPLRQTAGEVARLLQHFAPYCYLELEAAGVRSAANPQDLVLGIEHVSAQSMQPLLTGGAENAITRRARGLQQKIQAAGADGLLFVNGLSERPIDDFLVGLAEESANGEYTIAGIGLEHAEVFADPEEMRAVREAIPYAARMQQPAGRLVYKNHSDANIRLAAERVLEAAQAAWEINCAYVDAVESYFAAHGDIAGEILVYGHLNPYGLDPHNRVTMSSDDEPAFTAAREFLVEARARYYRELAEMCTGGGGEFVGGEKTADSELAIYAALGGPRKAPEELYRRF